MAEIQRRIDGLEIGSRFKLTLLLADIWAAQGNGRERIALGTAFSLGIKRGEIRRCRRFGLIGTDRDTYYERTA